MPIWTYTPLKTIVSGYTKALGMVTIVITFVNNKKVSIMGLFDRKNVNEETKELLASIDDQLQEDETEKSKVLDYMLELSDEDYEKLLKVAKIYREANRKAADIMGVPKALDGEKVEVRVEHTDESSTFIETDDTKGKTKDAKKATEKN